MTVETVVSACGRRSSAPPASRRPRRCRGVSRSHGGWPGSVGAVASAPWTPGLVTFVAATIRQRELAIGVAAILAYQAFRGRRGPGPGRAAVIVGRIEHLPASASARIDGQPDGATRRSPAASWADRGRILLDAVTGLPLPGRGERLVGETCRSMSVIAALRADPGAGSMWLLPSGSTPNGSRSCTALMVNAGPMAGGAGLSSLDRCNHVDGVIRLQRPDGGPGHRGHPTSRRPKRSCLAWGWAALDRHAGRLPAHVGET